jgi:hypothetical protein
MQNWLSDPLPLVAWLPFYLVASVCAGVLAYIFSGRLYGRRLIAGAVFLAFLITSWFQDPPAQ